MMMTKHHVNHFECITNKANINSLISNLGNKQEYSYGYRLAQLRIFVSSTDYKTKNVKYGVVSN